MADTAAAPAAQAPAKSPKKKNKGSKSKKPANHPKYCDMTKAAISSLKERGGSSRQAILKYIMANYNVGKDEKVCNSHLKMALRAGVKNGNLKQAKGTGASGSFKLGEKAAAQSKKKSASPKKTAKPKTIKAKSPAKSKNKKSKAKKSAATKKPKSPKKTGAKKAAKTKKPTTPKKKASPKKATGKKGAKKWIGLHNSCDLK